MNRDSVGEEMLRGFYKGLAEAPLPHPLIIDNTKVVVTTTDVSLAVFASLGLAFTVFTFLMIYRNVWRISSWKWFSVFFCCIWVPPVVVGFCIIFIFGLPAIVGASGMVVGIVTGGIPLWAYMNTRHVPHG